MATSIKKAIALHKEQDQKIKTITKVTHKSYSKLIQEVVDNYLKAFCC